MSRGPDAGTVLQRALMRESKAAGCVVTIADARTTRWASATFTGAQHRLSLDAADDAALEMWLGGLDDADIVLRGHLLADIAVIEIVRTDGRATVTVEALTVEE